jgi:hypothetical protein
MKTVKFISMWIITAMHTTNEHVKDISHKKAYVRIMIAFPHEIGLASVS